MESSHKTYDGYKVSIGKVVWACWKEETIKYGWKVKAERMPFNPKSDSLFVFFNDKKACNTYIEAMGIEELANNNWDASKNKLVSKFVQVFDLDLNIVLSLIQKQEKQCKKTH
jgi:hypothetical protein